MTRDETALSSPEARRAELRRMRTIATSLLVLMTLIFVATRFAPPSWGWAPYVGAFAEAGMVGACADWFAVVALFRRPLGLPIPHTAIVPENRRRIGASLGRFVTNNFLSPRVAAERLKAVDLVRLAAAWLEEPRNGAMVTDAVHRFVPYALEAVPKEATSRWLSTLAARGIEALPAAPIASQAIAILWADGAGQTLLDQGLDLVEGTLASNKAALVEQVRRQSLRWIPKWVDEIIATTILHGVSSTLGDMRRPDHPWRGEVEARVKELIEALAHDPAMRAKGEDLKRQLLASEAFNRQTQALARALEASLRREGPERAEAFAAWALGTLKAFVHALDADPARRERANDSMRRVVLQIVLPRREEVGAYISHVVDRWDAKTLVDRLELQVGRDLQYIRINGTLVGGLVGLVIYSLTRAFGF